MTRPPTVAVLGSVLLVGVLGLSLFGRGPGDPAPRGTRSLALDDLMGALQIVPLAGQPAPAFALPMIDGGRLALTDLAGRPALLYFWATW
jgi:hypothetical protein